MSVVSNVNRQQLKTPVFIDYTPEYERKRGINNEIDYFAPSSLERSPEEDEICIYNKNELMSYAPNMYAKAKLPSGKDAINTIALVSEALTVLTAAVKSGRNLFEAIADWVNSSKNMSDTDKVKALQVGSALAKEFSVSEAA